MSTGSETRAALLAALLESAGDAIVAVDRAGRVIAWNRAAGELYGWEAAEIVGRLADLLEPAGSETRLDPALARARRSAPPFRGLAVRRRRDGTLVEVDLTVSPLSDETGAALGHIEIARPAPAGADHAGELASLRRARAALEQAARRKDEFLAVLGHELRNPLAAVRGAADLQKTIPLEHPVLARTRDVIDRQVAHMVHLVDDLLDLSRIARGKIRLARDTFDIAVPVRTVLSDQEDAFAARSLELRAELAAEPLWVAGDASRLYQVVDNLVGNALKFTEPPGRVTVRTHREGDWVVVGVRDTGVGIEPDQIEDLFHPFRQAEPSGDHSAGGLGLGLALVRGLARLHGGNVEARSEGPGTGAEFVVRLPLAHPPGRRQARPSAARAERRRVLIVDDNRDVADMLRASLLRAGHEVAVAYDAHEAIEVARRLRPEVVLCDIGLPGGASGYDVARALRADAKLRGARLVALTGYGQPEDRRRARQAGFDGHLTKPVDLQRLQAVIAGPP